MKRILDGSWPELRRPWRGSHWWYRQLTGTRWTYPYQEPRSLNVWWKSLISSNYEIKRPARLLNLMWSIRFFKEAIKRNLVDL